MFPFFQSSVKKYVSRVRFADGCLCRPLLQYCHTHYNETSLKTNFYFIVNKISQRLVISFKCTGESLTSYVLHFAQDITVEKIFQSLFSSLSIKNVIVHFDFKRFFSKKNFSEIDVGFSKCSMGKSILGKKINFFYLPTPLFNQVTGGSGHAGVCRN